MFRLGAPRGAGWRAPGVLTIVAVLGFVGSVAPLAAQQPDSPTTTPNGSPESSGAGTPRPPYVFDMGQIDVVASRDGQPGVGGAVVSSDQIWTYDRKSLDQAVNVVPGVISTFDANGRRNESDIFVRGFG